ncbi:hypothetical protein BDV28DRAFT_145344 [Aspergillus coremiiformis]|uniref:Polyketide synthase n=1 Tax=Aspergillus coremiiformis TaxID=138285 RepID=A0A5N6ZHQ5_9EURO|nr:hypothetical protein BDV28DRAFT_145344 [Aspergillus coremiiformis]
MTNIYLFGDQSIPTDGGLRKLLLGMSKNPTLKSFLDEAFFAIQREISYLPSKERVSLPEAHTLALFLDAIQKGRRHVALESALLCLYEIGEYIHLLQSMDLCHPPIDSLLVGFCTGSLAAAAIACSRTVIDLLAVGMKAVVVAFRLGMHVARRTNALGGEVSQNLKSWTLVIADILESQAAQILREFGNDDENIPGPWKPYISAVGTGTVTISGTPKAIEALQKSPHLRCKKSICLPVYAPYHSAHIHGEEDAERILRSSPINKSMLCQGIRTPLVSCATGMILKETTFGDLLRVLVSEILTCPIRLDILDESIVQHVSKSSIRLIPIHTNVATKMTPRLTEIGLEVECVRAKAPEEALMGIHQQRPSQDSSKIAITGFSGRFPAADSLAEFWTMLQQGLDVHKPIPADRFDREAHYDATFQRKNTSRILHGCWIRNPGLFDARFFRMSPREACQADPAQRLALLTAYEAMEMAGFVLDRTPSSRRDRVGVYYGMTSDDWREVNSGQDIDTYFIPGGIRAFVSGRLNYFFKFGGPSIVIDTACSSSLAAIDIACTALLNRDCDTAVAGGTNIITSPDNFAGLDRAHFLSPTGNCKTFDDGADGYCRADGVGTVLLKRLSDAVADNDPIFGVIVGAQTSHSAEAVSITRPLADTQAKLFRQLLIESGIHPHDITYIEMHGTGTQFGDAAEMESVLNTFAWDHSRGRDQPLDLGSVKANVGHGESASGVTALIKVLLMMQKNCIPPHCGIKERINHHFPMDMEQRNVHIPLRQTEWPRPRGGKRCSFVNNFSAAGGNTALLLEDAPSSNLLTPASSKDPRMYHIVAVSSRSSKALSKNIQVLAEAIGCEASPELLGRIGYTTTARRMHHPYRVAFASSDIQDIKRQLLAATVTAYIEPCPAKTPGVGFLFTGQGTQQTAMAQDLYQLFASFHADITDFDAIGRGHGLPSILPLITGTVEIKELSPIIIQVGTVVIQIAMARLWQNWGVTPQYALGHSLGEYAAIYVAGVLSISDTIYLAGSRAVMLEKRCMSGTHGMVSVKASVADLKEILSEMQVEIACINGKDDTVLSGPNAAIDRAAEKLLERGVRFKSLSLPFAFHSSQVDPILNELEHIANQVTFRPPKIPIVSPLLGQIIQEGGYIGAKYIRRHCREPVNFLGAVHAAEREGIISSSGLAVEVSTHPILKRLVKNTVGPDFRVCPTLCQREDTFKTLTESLSMLYLGGVSVDWDEYHRDFNGSQQVVTLPPYSWDYENYWIQYQNNFCLTKGCPTESVHADAFTTVPTRLSSSVQKIVEERVDASRTMIVIESDMNDSELLPVALGHKVNGLALCPSSLYADIGYTIGRYLLMKHQGLEEYKIDICNMVVEKALVFKATGIQLIRASLDMDWNVLRGNMKVYSVDETGNCVSEHAHCTIALQRAGHWEDNWHRQFYLIQRSIEQLKREVENGSTDKIHRGLVYQLFSFVMQYSSSYQGMEEVIFDSSKFEATARVCLQPTEGQYALNPYWSDSFGHLTGFIMNCNDSLDLTEHIFVNHGWSFLRCNEPFSTETIYQTHVRMQPMAGNDSLYVGDVYVLRNNRIIAQFGAVKFQKVQRRILEMLLPAPASKRAAPGIKPKNPGATKPARLFRYEERAQSPPVSSVWQQVLGTIAQEIGVHPRQLTDAVQFADVGVDSLMSLNILGILRESLGLDVPSTLFQDFPSVQSLQAYLSISSASGVNNDGSCSSTSPGGNASTAATLPSVGDEEQSTCSEVDIMGNTVSLVLSILAEETGVALKELFKENNLTERGLDSLLSLTALGRVREEMNLDLPQHFFLEHTSVSSITAALQKILYSAEDSPESVAGTLHPPATSVLLQGNESSSQRLFLFPDGSGSSTSYTMLPTISPDLRVYAMNCPYLKHPEELKCNLQDLTPAYISEIRRRQPHGPYNLSGWSAGGIAAYEAAQYLVKQGEIVDRLILIDSPNPMGLGKFPPQFYDFLEERGVFGSHGGQKAPEWLIQHFKTYTNVLDLYRPVPFVPACATPRTTIVWAEDGVCKSPGDPQPELRSEDPGVMAWLLENRAVLGPNGWDQLLGEANIHIESVPDADHFSIVRHPAATRLTDILRKAMLGLHVRVDEQDDNILF